MTNLWIFAAISLFVAFAGLVGSNQPAQTDGVFESATEKMDKGRPDLLTDRERQRVNDIINWCDKCKQPYRTCKHGPNAP